MSICIRRGSVFVLFLLAGCSWVAAAQNACDAAYAEAEEAYTQGRFDQAVSLLAPCMERPEVVEADREMQVYRLLALAYVRRGDLDEAQIAILELLSRHPSYEPDPVDDPPAYVSLVTLVRQRFALERAAEQPAASVPPREELPPQRRSFLKSPITWISLGGGAALATILVLAGGGGGNGGGPGTSLPDPPALP